MASSFRLLSCLVSGGRCLPVLMWMMAIVNTATVEAFIPMSPALTALQQIGMHGNAGPTPSGLQAHAFATEAYLAQLSSSSILPESSIQVDPQAYVQHVAAQAAELTSMWPQNEELWQRIAQASEYSSSMTVVESTTTASTTLLSASVANTNNLFSVTTLGDVAQSAADVVVKGSQGFVDAAGNVFDDVTSLPQKFLQGTEKQANFVATAELADLGKAAVDAVGKVAEAVLVVFNVLLEAMTGMTIADVVQTAQNAVQDMVSSSTQAVASSLEQLGSMTLQEAAVSVFRLVVAVTTILFRIFSGVLELVTGKTAAEWSVTAQQAIASATQDALTAAARTASDISHKSLTQLVAMMGQWESDMTHTVMTTAQNAMTNEPFLSGTVAISSLGGNIH